MSYIKKNWLDEIRDAQGNIVQDGTPVNSSNMNNIEEGIFASSELGCETVRTLIYHGQTLKKLIGEVGMVTLTNSLAYPFNSSKATVSLAAKRDTLDYTVDVEAAAAGKGDVGRILITEKQLNGFKLEHTGSAASVSVKFIVRGGVY